jgi:hypothetical protein
VVPISSMPDPALTLDSLAVARCIARLAHVVCCLANDRSVLARPDLGSPGRIVLQGNIVDARAGCCIRVGLDGASGCPAWYTFS